MNREGRSMKKILFSFLVIAVGCIAIPYISLAENESPSSTPALQKDTEQDINDMIKLLEELQTEEEMNEESLLPKNATEKTEAKKTETINSNKIFAQPEENLKLPSDPVKKNNAENIFEPVDETITNKTVTPDLVYPSGSPQSGDQFSADKTDQPNEIEKNVNEMLKALEELQNSQIENLGDNLNPADAPTENNTARKSIEKTDEVVRLDSIGPDGHFQSGLLYWKSKDLEAAIQEFQEVIRLAPVNAHAYWNLGLLYDESGRGSLAIANIKKAKDIYSKYNYPEYVEDARKRLNRFSEKYGDPLPEP
jgi:tetratricopeptide (TPR) repeat protein